jgi:hypothetical protein
VKLLKDQTRLFGGLESCLVMPDLIRHPRWRATMDCGSSPQ